MIDFEKILPLVVPSEEEVKKAKAAEEVLRKRLNELGVEYMFVGSYARNTWLKGNLEIDVFILFPENVEREELEERGLEIGKSVLDEYEIRYAEHPYVHGKVLGVEVDVVPCYKVKDPRNIKSAVDRTPFHHMWLKDRIKGKENDVRLFKRFLKVNNLYGAEYKVRGFSGYLCELLVVFYGSFLDVVKNATKWTRRTVIDVPKGEVRKGKSFFVVDPVDEKRNVAANLSLDNLARFVHLSRLFVRQPSESFFLEKEKVPPSKEVLKRALEDRGSAVFVIKFERPDIVEDNLYPQLDRAVRKINEFLERENFMPLRGRHAVKGESCYLIFECQVRELSKVVRKLGPPFEEERHVERFLSKKREFEPFIEEGRWWAYDYRKFCRPEDAVKDFIEKNWRALGKNVGEKLSENFEVYHGVEVLNLGINLELAEFLGVKF